MIDSCDDGVGRGSRRRRRRRIVEDLPLVVGLVRSAQRQRERESRRDKVKRVGRWDSHRITHLPVRPQMASFSPPRIVKFKFFRARFRFDDLLDESSYISRLEIKDGGVADVSFGALLEQSTSQYHDTGRQQGDRKGKPG